MKLKNILYRNFDSLTEKEKRFFYRTQKTQTLGLCDKYNTVQIELVYVEHDFEELSPKGIAECEKHGYVSLCIEAWEELLDM